MNKKRLAAMFILLVLLLGLAFRYFYVVPTSPEEPGNQETIKMKPSPANEANPAVNNVQEITPAKVGQQIPTAKQEKSSQHISKQKVLAEDDTQVNLSDYAITIKKEEKKGFQIMPGVTVKSGVAQMQLDQDNNRYIEIERNPPNSNNQYQMMLKKKF